MKRCSICGQEIDTGYVVHRTCLSESKRQIEKQQNQIQRLQELIMDYEAEIEFLQGRLACYVRKD